MKSLAIVCDSKEIAYGITLKRLFVFNNDKTCFTSSKGKQMVAEIYTCGTFAHSNIAKDTCCVFVNKDTNPSTATSIYNEYGIRVLKDGFNFYVFADSQNLLNTNYHAFISKANEKKKQYEQLEAEYINNVISQSNSWFPHDFIALSANGLFGKNKLLKDMLQQQFDYIAYVIYLTFATGDEKYVR